MILDAIVVVERGPDLARKCLEESMVCLRGCSANLKGNEWCTGWDNVGADLVMMMW